MNETLTQVIKEMKPILNKNGIKKAEIFGSFARGEHNKKSDIDLLIDPPKNMDLIDLIKVRSELELRVKRRVDISTYRAINPIFEKSILSHRVRII